MSNEISRRVLARYRREVDLDSLGDSLDELWDSAVHELPNPLRMKLQRPKESTDSGFGEVTLSREIELALDSDKDVMFFLSMSVTGGEDADEDGAYQYRNDRLSYWMTAEPWTAEGGGDGGDTQDLKRDVKQWVDRVTDFYPEVAKRWF